MIVAVRGRRIESLQLLGPGGRARTLASWIVRADGGRAAQALYRVAPGGERFAWLMGGQLHLVEADGSSRIVGRGVSVFRFAPSGSQLAVVEHDRLLLLDVATPARRELGPAPKALAKSLYQSIVKKEQSQKAPKKEIETAHRRMRELL